jgi:hypothetical protein
MISFFILPKTHSCNVLLIKFLRNFKVTPVMNAHLAELLDQILVNLCLFELLTAVGFTQGKFSNFKT